MHAITHNLLHPKYIPMIGFAPPLWYF